MSWVHLLISTSSCCFHDHFPPTHFRVFGTWPTNHLPHSAPPHPACRLYGLSPDDAGSQHLHLVQLAASAGRRTACWASPAGREGLLPGRSCCTLIGPISEGSPQHGWGPPAVTSPGFSVECVQGLAGTTEVKLLHQQQQQQQASHSLLQQALWSRVSLPWTCADMPSRLACLSPALHGNKACTVHGAHATSSICMLCGCHAELVGICKMRAGWGQLAAKRSAVGWHGVMWLSLRLCSAVGAQGTYT